MKTLKTSILTQASILESYEYTVKAGLLTTPEVSSSHFYLCKNSDLDCTSFLDKPVEITAAGLFRVHTEFPFNSRRNPGNQIHANAKQNKSAKKKLMRDFFLD